MGCYEEALSAWTHCKERKGDIYSPELNQAIVYGRWGKPEQGLQLLATFAAPDSEQENRLDQTLAWLHWKSGHEDTALEIIQDLRQRGAANALVISYEGEIALIRGNIEEAIRLAKECIALDKTSYDGALLLRKAQGHSAPGSRIYYVSYSGEMELKDELHGNIVYGYFASCHVKAATQEDALEYIRPFEPNTIGEIEIARFEECDKEVEGFDGVIEARGGYTFFTGS